MQNPVSKHRFLTWWTAGFVFLTLAAAIYNFSASFVISPSQIGVGASHIFSVVLAIVAVWIVLARIRKWLADEEGRQTMEKFNAAQCSFIAIILLGLSDGLDFPIKILLHAILLFAFLVFLIAYGMITFSIKKPE